MLHCNRFEHTLPPWEHTQPVKHNCDTTINSQPSVSVACVSASQCSKDTQSVIRQHCGDLLQSTLAQGEKKENFAEEVKKKTQKSMHKKK